LSRCATQKPDRAPEALLPGLWAYRRHRPRFVSRRIASSCSRPIWASRCSCVCVSVAAMVVIISASVPATSSGRAEAYRPWWRRWLAS
jgi:hypothetical protein